MHSPFRLRFGAWRGGTLGWLLVLMGALVVPTAPALSQSDAAPQSSEQTTPPKEDEPVPVPERKEGVAAARGDGDRIINMRRLLESDRNQKIKLEEELSALDAEFEEAAGEFERMDVELTSAQTKRDAATDPAQKAKLGDLVERLTSSRGIKRARFEMVIDRRKAVQQQLATLAEKLTLVEEYLQRLMAPSTPPPPLSPASSAPAKPDAPAPTATEGGRSIALPGLPAIPITGPEAGAGVDREPDALDEELKAARKDRRARIAALDESQERVKRLEHAIEVFERDLVSSRELLGLANKAAASEDDTLRVLNEHLEARRKNGEMEEDLAWLVAERNEARRRSDAAHEDVATQTGRIAKSESTVERLKKNRDEAVHSIAKNEGEVRAADRKVWFLNSPMAPYKLSWWFTNKGPRVAIALIAAFAIYWITKRVAGRLLGKVLQRSGRGDAAVREGRAETLRRVFDSTAGVVIVVMGILTALNQAGVNVTVLLGGAAVIGAAIAFGSQNLIKDYFSGFMILMENQYSVGNVIRVGVITGTVENITLRMTSLRDLEGVLHFIPHSQVLSVSNLTYGWSRIVMDIKVNVAEDPDKVMELIMNVANDLKGDAEFGPQFLGDPEMLGVDQLGGAAMVIKVLVKTKPLNRWPVKREMLRRIKKQFDAAGVKMA